MKSVNKIILLGNVTRDPEVKATDGKQTVCTFGLATNRCWKDKGGKKQTVAEFHNVVSFGKLAEFSGKYVKKGKPVYIEGYSKTQSWENPENNVKMFKTEVVVENMSLLSPRDKATEVPEAEAAEASVA
ncbi:single-stranded DNA-binding protein [Candidatus Peregrinibacteria bacterium]|nr:single-stranded DNA-binding protein [Candidatus Peregrinibacteria bacterium]